MFKVGDIVIVSPLFDDEMKENNWWNIGKNQILTIKEEIFQDVYSVNENSSWWRGKWLIKKEEDFITEEEFKM